MASGSFKTEHHYVSALALIGIGVLGMVGSITGSLAAMLAGLFLNNNGKNTGLVTVGAPAAGGGTITKG